MRERYYLRDQKVEIRLQMHIALFLVGRKLYVGNCSRAAAQASCRRCTRRRKLGTSLTAAAAHRWKIDLGRRILPFLSLNLCPYSAMAHIQHFNPLKTFGTFCIHKTRLSVCKCDIGIAYMLLISSNTDDKLSNKLFSYVRNN